MSRRHIYLILNADGIIISKLYIDRHTSRQHRKSFTTVLLQYLDMTMPRKGKGRKRKSEDIHPPPSLDEPQPSQDELPPSPDEPQGSLDDPKGSQDQAPGSQDMPPPSHPPRQDTKASSQGRKRKLKEGPKLANIEFPDEILDVFFGYMEDHPVLWSNDKQYAFQKKQRREEAWENLVATLKERFPNHDPEEFTSKLNIYDNFS